MDLLEFIRFRLPSVIGIVVLLLLNLPRIPILASSSEYLFLKVVGIVAGVAIGEIIWRLVGRSKRSGLIYALIIFSAVLLAVFISHHYEMFRLDSENFPQSTKYLYTALNFIIGVLLWSGAYALRLVAATLFEKDGVKKGRRRE